MMPADAWADLKERIATMMRERSNLVRGSAYHVHVPELVAEVESLRALHACDASFGPDGLAVGNDYEFTCPRCAGHSWGTGDATSANAAEWIGYCLCFGSAEDGYASCGFTWPRGDDAKVFAPRRTR